MKKKLSSREIKQWFFVALPIVAIIGAGLLPLPTVVRQSFIGIALIWFQVSLMLGVFS